VLVQIDNDGDGDPTDVADDEGVPGTDTPVPFPIGPERTWVVNAWTARANWGYDTRNDYLLPSAGLLHHVQAEIALPGSDLEYYRLSYDFEHYWHPKFARWLIVKSAVSLGYGDSYGETHDKQCLAYTRHGIAIPGTEDSCPLPFFKNFYAGGPGSIRGFTANTVGPTYSPLLSTSNANQQPLGGAVKTTGSFEFFFPRLLDGVPGSRVSAFVDYGNVYARPGDFEFNQFRISAGLALQWQSPVGPITISYAMPIDYGRCQGISDAHLTTCVQDDIERLQFTFGNQ
jgi:outer membrane protein insertion porin family